jgi:sugar phosphate isomerase/epimerase
MMKVSFSTLACPKWSWNKILKEARNMGYDGIEIRGLEGELDLSRMQPFFPENIKGTMEQLRNKNLEICCLDTSCIFHDAALFEKGLIEGKLAIDLAPKLNCKYIRIFGNNIPDKNKEDEMLSQIASGINELGTYAEGTGVTVLVETHGDFSMGAAMNRLLDRVISRNIGVLWDLSNGYIEFGEPIADTFHALSSRIKHTHLKDAKGIYPHAELCMFGQGDLPATEMIGLLRSIDYDGWLSLEFEKMWHPELAEPEVSLAAYISEIKKAM